MSDERTLGQRVADDIATFVGSWNFLIGQSVLLLLWALLNSSPWWEWKWDGYPFIAMNLLLSLQAAYATPLILLSQNRQAVKDRDTAERDLATDQKAEAQIEQLLDHLDQQDHTMMQMLERIDALLEHKEGEKRAS